MTIQISLRPSMLAVAIAMALPMLALAAPGSTSPYRTDAQYSHVEDATSRGVNQVNMITCFMTSMRPDALVNQGNYIALVDQKKCDPEARSSTDNSGSNNAGSSAPSYMTAIVNATRTSNTDPMRVRTWVEEKDRDFSATIFVNVAATEAPSDSNPYGVFRLDYCGKGDAGGSCMMNGYLEGSATGISYFEVEQGGGGSQSKALRLTTSGADSGAGRLQFVENGTPMAFSFAYSANHFLRGTDSGQDQCFSRDATDPDTRMSVWRYGLYDAETGERVTRNSGFPIEYTTPGGQAVHGHMGYWGLWLPPEVSISSGATVQRVQYNSGSEPTKTDFTLVKAEGRLMKYTKRTRTLAAIDKIRFQTWVGDVTGFFTGAQANQQYEMYWDDTAGVFKVVGMVRCEGGPCQTSNLEAEQSVAASFFANMGGVRGWSQALGGELFVPLAGLGGGSINSSTLNVIYRTQDLVYPADMPATLYCLRDCPTAASIAAFFADGSAAASPYTAGTFMHWGPTAPGAVVSYTSDTSAALLRDGANAAITFTDRDALQSRPQYQWGVRTGRLFTNLAAALCDDATNYCDHKVELVDEYYQWETGPNQWNQFAALRDGTGAVVTFQAPLQVTYNVPTGVAYGPYAGKSIVLQYGGFGELWGIPGHCVSRLTNSEVSCDTPDSRYVPAFVIPFDETLGRVDSGGTPLLAKWLDREIRFARKDPAVCAAAGVALPSGLTLPTASSLANPSDPASSIYIGAKPTVTDAPRVIHGDVKF